MKRYYEALLFTLFTKAVVPQTLFNTEVPPIVYKRQAALYDWVYDDTNTGAEDAITIYKVGNFQHDFYRLGDLAIGDYEKPINKHSTVLVKDMTGDALRAPVDAEWVWDDSGTGGSYAVTIYKLKPPAGYVCLGDVAVPAYNEKPDFNQYRCVKKEYVTDGKYEWIWDDSGSGGDHDFVARANRVSTTNTYGIDAGTFTGFKNYSDPENKAQLLDGQVAMDIMDVNIWNPDAIITLYEMPEVQRVWDDTGTGAYKAIQVWRVQAPEGAYSLGDFANNDRSYWKPGVALAARANEQDILDVPAGFNQVWIDTGSGGNEDVIFYKPLCNPGFRPLGHVAVASYSEEPDSTMVRCVNEKYTMEGADWQFIWDDLGSGATRAIRVYRAIPSNDGQGLGAMSAIGAYTEMDEPPYVLDPAYVNYMFGLPAKQYLLTSVEYDLDSSEIFNQQPENIDRATAVNKDDNTTQSIELTIEYSYTEEYNWNNHIGGEWGIEMTITAGIPFLIKEETSVSMVADYSHDWGGTTSETITRSITATVNVPPCKLIETYVVGNRYNMDVPYTATLTTVYLDDSTGTRQVEGVFRGVEVNDIRVEFGKAQPIDDCTPAGKRKGRKGGRKSRERKF